MLGFSQWQQSHAGGIWVHPFIFLCSQVRQGKKILSSALGVSVLPVGAEPPGEWKSTAGELAQRGVGKRL